MGLSSLYNFGDTVISNRMEVKRMCQHEAHDEKEIITTWAYDIPSTWDICAFGLEDKAVALATTSKTWAVDMAKWRKQAFVHEANQDQKLKAKQREYKRQMLQSRVKVI